MMPSRGSGSVQRTTVNASLKPRAPGVWARDEILRPVYWQPLIYWAELMMNCWQCSPGSYSIVENCNWHCHLTLLWQVIRRRRGPKQSGPTARIGGNKPPLHWHQHEIRPPKTTRQPSIWPQLGRGLCPRHTLDPGERAAKAHATSSALCNFLPHASSQGDLEMLLPV
jgi:hypothetical protein